MTMMNKYNDLDMFCGNLIIYKDCEYKSYMNHITLVYNGEEDYFLLLDNTIIGFLNNLMTGLDKKMIGLEDAFEKRKFSIIPKKEEDYIFVDKNSLVNLNFKKGKN